MVARALSRTHMSTNSKEESLFKADAVNEEDPERDLATQVWRRRKGDGLFKASAVTPSATARV